MGGCLEVGNLLSDGLVPEVLELGLDRFSVVLWSGNSVSWYMSKSLDKVSLFSDAYQRLFSDAACSLAISRRDCYQCRLHVSGHENSTQM